eukprot:gb/GEZN01003774.1/.p1 GENE.gb/GEZN01003774.1/~~gb/GEZN01003774.1/.p1  ORF type:complete len:685 (+),score=118.80 gb/GEZN01003774.1/:119-2056(+)
MSAFGLDDGWGDDGEDVGPSKSKKEKKSHDRPAKQAKSIAEPDNWTDGDDGFSDDDGMQTEDAGDWGALNDDPNSSSAFGMDDSEPPSPVQAKPYRFLELTEIQKMREKFVREQSESLYMPIADTDAILRFLRYDSRGVNKFLENSAYQADLRKQSGVPKRTKPLPGQGDWSTSSSSLPTKGGSSSSSSSSSGKGMVKCGAGCQDEPYPASQCHSLACGHSLCFDCWRGFLCSQVDSAGLQSVFSKCPALQADGKKCREVVDDVTMEQFLDIPRFEKYKRWVLENYVESISKLKFCPGKQCGLVVECAKDGQIDVHCKCGTNWCFNCAGPAHTPCPCDLQRKWAEEINNDDAASQRLIQSLTMPCPKCQTRIEKNRHCNHMKCTKCSFDFCWQCRQEMKIGEKHPDWYKCLVRSSDEAKNKPAEISEVEKSRVQNTQFLAKLGYHQRKVEDADKDRKSAESLLKKLDEYEQNIGQNLGWAREIFKNIAEAHRYLMWSNVYCYFLKDSGRKVTFEKWLQVLEEKARGTLRELDKGAATEAAMKEILQDNTRISSMKKNAATCVEKMKSLTEIALQLSEALMYEADVKTSTWKCIRCEHTSPTEKPNEKTPGVSSNEMVVVIRCQNAMCRACRKHGDFDCLTEGCKT